MKNLNHQYHISGAVKSAVAYVSEGSGTNQLEKVMGSMSIDDSGNKRDMSADNNFLYDRDGNMIEDKSKKMTVKYDHRGLPVEFKREVLSNENGADSVRLVLNYGGAGSRISKIRERKSAGETSWTMELATHYTGIGSEIREDAINNATKVVVNLPQGLGRYDIASASESSANTVPSFEWYLKNHLGSTMLVYGTQSISDPNVANLGSLKAAYDYRAFGEQVDLTWPTNKVTETFTGKEKDDETELSYFGARYLDQMLGMWVSVDAKRQFNSPYLYMGNRYNPIIGFDPDGNRSIVIIDKNNVTIYLPTKFTGPAATPENIKNIRTAVETQFSGQFGEYNVTTKVIEGEMNVVELLDGKGISRANGNDGIASIYMGGAKPLYSAKHEFGHLMGMDDKYGPNENNGGYSAFEGYEKNIMGAHDQYGVMPNQIEEAFGEGEHAQNNYILEKN